MFYKLHAACKGSWQPAHNVLRATEYVYMHTRDPKQWFQ
jgi:hypothetical protein